MTNPLADDSEVERKTIRTQIRTKTKQKARKFNKQNTRKHHTRPKRQRLSILLENLADVLVVEEEATGPTIVRIRRRSVL